MKKRTSRKSRFRPVADDYMSHYQSFTNIFVYLERETCTPNVHSATILCAPNAHSTTNLRFFCVPNDESKRSLLATHKHTDLHATTLCRCSAVALTHTGTFAQQLGSPAHAEKSIGSQYTTTSTHTTMRSHIRLATFGRSEFRHQM